MIRRKKFPIDKNGFHFKSHGRAGIIAYIEDGNVLEIYYESSGAREYDILLAPIDLTEWMQPKGEKIPKNKQLEILHKLRDWLQLKRFRSNIDFPAKVELTNEQCLLAGCESQTVKGSFYCQQHYEEMMLRK